jgi:hypothetical protein
MVSLQGRNITAHEHLWWTMVRIAFLPCLGGSPVIRSMAMCSNGHASPLVPMRYGGVLFLCQDFVLLAGGTSLDIFRNPLLGSWPIVLFHHLSVCLVSSWVSCNRGVMPDFHDLSSYFLVWWDDEFASRAPPYKSSAAFGPYKRFLCHRPWGSM